MLLHFCIVHFFDANGRPLEAGYYTGFPAYHNLVYVSNPYMVINLEHCYNSFLFNEHLLR